MTRIPVTAANTTINGYSWRWSSMAFDDLDWTDAVLDPGGTIFGPGPYLKVAYGGSDRDLHGTRHRIRPKHPLKPGRVQFVADAESACGWSMVPVAASVARCRERRG